MFLDHLLGGLVQVAGAGIVAESFPGLQYVIQRGRCQRVGCGKLGKEAFIVRNDGLNPRLLEHDLSDPDGIGIRGAAPRKVAAVVVVPL
jgi:hypothetical protein